MQLSWGMSVLIIVLALDPSSQAAFQALLFLHLHTDDYASALNLVENPPLPADLPFERAYCLYRLHREQEALDILKNNIGEKGRREDHLEAQIVCRYPRFLVLPLNVALPLGSIRASSRCL